MMKFREDMTLSEVLRALRLARALGMPAQEAEDMLREFFPKTYKMLAAFDKHYEFIEKLRGE